MPARAASPDAADANASPLRPFDRSLEKPSLAGLRLDQRGIVVGAEAVLRLTDSNRLTQLLGGLSEIVDLTRVEIRLHAKRENLLFLQPPDDHADNLSVFYDRIASVSQLAEAQLFVGADQVFVPFRDHEAPLGYDVSKPPAKKGRKLRLIGIHETIEISPGKLKSVPIRDAILGSTPTADRRKMALSSRLYVLTVPALQKTLCRYLRSQGLNCRLALIATAPRSRGVLLEVETFDASGVPAFVVAYLRSYPRTTVLRDVLPDSSRQVLVDLGYQTPWSWQNTATAFEEGSLIALTSTPDFPGLCLEPAPQLTDADVLLNVQAGENTVHVATPLKKSTPSKCRFEIRFQRDNGPPTAPIALLLQEKELTWLRRLLYKMPASEFSGYRVLSASPFSVLWSEQRTVGDLPFGVPLKRVFDTDLWIPCPLRLVPQLPFSALAGALQISTESITILTEDVRLELDRSSFVPLSDLLYSDLNREPNALTLKSTRRLPNLTWTPPAGFDEDDVPVLAGTSADNVSDQPVRRRRREKSGSSEDDDLAEAALLKSRAEKLRAADDPLGAALYLALAGELGTSASLLRQYAQGNHSRGLER